uniref:Uncharacterized protein n=1 Tax=Anguilla anguilla TaxID=7936 RepID=A0A0E9SLT8_ANGAN
MEKNIYFAERWGGILLFLAIYIFFHSNYRFLEMFMIFLLS